MALRILTISDKGPEGGGTRVQVDRASRALERAGLAVVHLRLGAVGDSADKAVIPSTFWSHQGLARRAALIRQVDRLRPDVIHIHGSGSSMSAIVFAALKKRWPVVVTLHDVDLFCMSGVRLFQGHSADVCQRRAGLGCWSSGCWRPPGALGLPLAGAHLFAKTTQRRAWLSAARIIVPSRYLADLAQQH